MARSFVGSNVKGMGYVIPLVSNEARHIFLIDIININVEPEFKKIHSKVMGEVKVHGHILG